MWKWEQRRQEPYHGREEEATETWWDSEVSRNSNIKMKTVTRLSFIQCVTCSWGGVSSPVFYLRVIRSLSQCFFSTSSIHRKYLFTSVFEWGVSWVPSNEQDRYPWDIARKGLSCKVSLVLEEARRGCWVPWNWDREHLTVVLWKSSQWSAGRDICWEPFLMIEHREGKYEDNRDVFDARVFLWKCLIK